MIETIPLGRLAIAAQGQHIIAWRKSRALTHADLATRVADWTATLQRQPGTNCALALHDGFEFASALLGAWHAGKTVWLPGDAQAVTVEALRRHVSCFIGEFDHADALLAPDRTPGTALEEVPPSHPALKVFTSGSTGQPAIIPKTLGQLDAEIRGMQTQWGTLVQNATIIATVPHQHFYGLLFKLLWPLARSASVISNSLDYPEELCATAAAGPCIVISSPALLSRLPELEWPKHNLRAVFSAGSPLPREAAQRCEQLLGQWPEEVYGSSETGVIARRTQQAGTPPWQCLHGVHVRRDEASGQLEIFSDWVDETPCRLADRGEVFKDGRFNLLGRADRIVKISEKRISLDALEHALMAAPEVAATRLLPLPGGRLAAVVVPTPTGQAQINENGTRALSERLRALLTTHVERVVLPRRWRFVAELPINALGKTTHAELLALFADIRPREPVVRTQAPEDDGIRLGLTVPHKLLYFDGHFPGAPILPGVVQINWAVEFSRRLFGVNNPFLRLEQIKFQQTIRPGMEVAMLLRLIPAKSTVEFKYTSVAGAHSSGRIVFGT